MNTQLLKAQMILNKETLADLSEVLGTTPGTLSNKITGKAEFKQSEIQIIARHYGLDAEQIKEIFFCN